VFSQRERSDISQQLVAAARTDDRISAAAAVGSAALDREDEWSDIDLAFRLAVGLEPADVADTWTRRMYEHHGAVDDLDIWSGSTLFRVFLCPPRSRSIFHFGLRTRSLQRESLSICCSAKRTSPRPLRRGRPIPSSARGRGLQALYMVNGVRDHVVSLACLRHGLPVHEGRGVDALPDEVKRTLADTVVRGVERIELSRAFTNVVTALLDEVEQFNPELASRLDEPARELVRSAADPRAGRTEDGIQ